jgi:hypothetical protein
MKYGRFCAGLTACSLLTLTACGGASGIRETLGIDNRAPDEFRVVSRPPLSVPPQFNLRPPSADARSPIIVPADKQARSIITGTPAQSESDIGYDNSVDTAVVPVESASIDKNNAKNKVSTSNSSFLSKIGADKADPKVRGELVEQKLQAQEKKEEGSWWSNLNSSSTEKKDTLVNAEQESKRIKDNKAANKPVTEGQTPEVKDKDRGLLGNIFGW